ncbi:hypothetical protein [Streptomyces lavendofoliae]|uniref:M20 family metallopeptidase n=1 Tax=Streptomyces lavendofoliae TaxID=67314 RepID=A0A918HXW1_9ACTN|nr:hypothetical protein GCM10010274_28910 [Streptomyces lavendofoliae]
MSPSPESVYDRIGEEVAARAERLWEVSLALHGAPETAFEEREAARLLSGELEREGFAVLRGVAGLPAAFTGRAGSGDGPCVALLMEYDALPLLGHACGHNLIAAAGLGAALAVRGALGEVPGIGLSEPVPGVCLGSSDIGNVGTRVPSIHPFVAIMGADASDHTPEFAEAAAGPRGRQVTPAAAEALACTAADVLLRPEVPGRA